MTKEMAIYLLESKHVFLTYEGRQLLLELTKENDKKTVGLNK
jgi:hypothetical protein